MQDLNDFIYEPNSNYQQKESLKNFDSIDMVSCLKKGLCFWPATNDSLAEGGEIAADTSAHVPAKIEDLLRESARDALLSLHFKSALRTGSLL